MAIGKASAYATVESSKVDFGEIALNAQKIQQSDLERMKDMIPKAEKSDFKIKDLDISVNKTGNGGWDYAASNFVADIINENKEVNEQAEAIGRYTPELIAKRQKLESQITGLKSTADKFTKDSENWAKSLNEGKFSSVDKNRFEIAEDIALRKGVEMFRDENGITVFKVRMMKDGAALSDNEGKPLYKEFNDRGVKKNTITKDELDSGLFFNNTIKELDRTKTIGEIQNNLKLRTSVVDSNGTLTRTRTFLTDEDKNYVDNAVNGVLDSNYDNLASYLYSLDREKYSTPKTMEQYKKDGDVEFAKKAMKQGVLAGLGFQDKEDRVKPTIIKVGGDKDKQPSKLPEIAKKAYTQVWRNTKGVQRSDISPSTVFSVNRGSSVKALGETAAANVIGKENSGKGRYFIQIRPIQSQSTNTEGVTKSIKKSGEKEFLFFNSDADDANDVLSYIINPSTGDYFSNTEEAKDYIDSMIPKRRTTTVKKSKKTNDPLGIL